jgi:hypothetical protein
MPGDPPTICEERIRLLRELSEGATSYAEKVREMVELAIAGRGSESNAARRQSRAAWDTAESSRIALFRHEADHFCDRAVESRSVQHLDSL